MTGLKTGYLAGEVSGTLCLLELIVVGGLAQMINLKVCIPGAGCEE